MARERCDECAKSREVVLELTVHWGGDKGDWSGEKAFCSWAHASEWLAEKAEENK